MVSTKKGVPIDVLSFEVLAVDDGTKHKILDAKKHKVEVQVFARFSAESKWPRPPRNGMAGLAKGRPNAGLKQPRHPAIPGM